MGHRDRARAGAAAVLAAVLALTACGTDDDPDAAQGDDRDQTDEQDESNDTGDGTPRDDAGNESSDEAPAAAEEVAGLDFAACRGERWTVEHPRDWHTNEPDRWGSCQVFDADEVELPERPRERDPRWAVTLDTDPVAWEEAQPDEALVVEARDTTVDGRRARVTEQRSEGAGLLPEGERAYTYLVDLEGEVLVATTTTVGETDYARDKAVLDHMMEHLEITGEDGPAGDWEEVAQHDAGQRTFSVHAASAPDGLCLEVRTPDGSARECGPVDDDIDVRVLTVDGRDYVAGVVEAAPIADVAMIANDGSRIADDARTTELVEILGQSGLRAFAPRHGPGTYRAVAGYGPDDREVARTDL